MEENTSSFHSSQSDVCRNAQLERKLVSIRKGVTKC